MIEQNNEDTQKGEVEELLKEKLEATKENNVESNSIQKKASDVKEVEQQEEVIEKASAPEEEILVYKDLKAIRVRCSSCGVMHQLEAICYSCGVPLCTRCRKFKLDSQMNVRVVVCSNC